ncbi:purine-cytosine permease family protein [Calditrichota bacterium LG25]
MIKFGEKNKKQDHSDLGGDYTLIPIPVNERKHWFDVALVWMGLNVCPPTLLLGVWLMRYQSFYDASISLVIGLIVLSVFSISQGIIGNISGLPTYPISRLSFGELGGRIFSFIMFLTLIGWFGIMTESMVATFYTQIFPVSGLNVPVAYRPFLAFFSGMGITAICFFGFKAITWLNRFTIPGLIFLTFFALVKVLQKPNLMAKVLTWKPINHHVSIYTGTTWVVGSLIIAAVTAPDFNRYCRRSRDTVYSVLLGNVPVVYFLTIMGMIFAVLSGAAEGKTAIEAADLSSVFASQGWNIGPVPGGYLAAFILIGAIITTNVANLYPGAMALVTVLKGVGKYWPYLEDRAVLTLFVGFLGSVAACWGLLSNLEYFLETLTYFAVPLIGIMGADFFILKNRKRIKGLLNVSAMITWIVFSFGALFKVLPGGGMTTVFYSVILYYALEKKFGNAFYLGRN